MGINFPSSPLVGELYPNPALANKPQYRWDGQTWTATGGQAGGIYVGDTPPPTPVPDNALWWKSDTGELLIRYNDGSSTQWVEATAVPSVDTSMFALKTEAAPLDALSYSGMQVNGSMEVSQQNGSSSVSASNTAKFVVDGWQIYSGGAQTVFIERNSNAPSGFAATLQMTVGPANSSPAAADCVQIFQNIEGYRISRLGWGTASAKPVTLGFWVAAVRTGVYSGSIRNGGSTRSYAFTFTINAANTFEYKTVTIPGDTTGTWAKDNTIGMILAFTVMSGSTFLTAPGAWVAGNFIGATGTINGVAATSDVFIITGVVVLPGIQAPTAAQSPLIMRPFDQELVTCKRYWKLSPPANGHWFEADATRVAFQFDHNPEMRIAPTVTPVIGQVSRPGIGYVAMGGIDGGGAPSTPRGSYVTILATGPIANVPAHLAAGSLSFDARL